MKYPSHSILDTTTRSITREYVNSRGGKLLIRQSIVSKSKSQPNTILTSFDVHFLRKERLYTKLKYSRCPQYDIVSGGFAAILAGFIGFLISEKFGIELVDSGDFYVAFMYIVFIVFSLRPLIGLYSKRDTAYNPLSLKHLISFVWDLTLLFIKTAHRKLPKWKRDNK